ncbi:hypothetical protein [Paenibacillus sp. R14(2021)]|uniref:hypothetical protein n=1 Tax=Paenibacillus sp. R14(2021) TaxID=2859228 RepID=UPI001C6140AF|nr:hypothetical protein [Paenibacillus sp. R14(2021)]
MFAVGQELYTDSDFKRALLVQVPVKVKCSNGEIPDSYGPIEEITLTTVKVAGMYFAKAVCRFFVR